jgi:hypothetical protein
LPLPGGKGYREGSSGFAGGQPSISLKGGVQTIKGNFAKNSGGRGRGRLESRYRQEPSAFPADIWPPCISLFSQYRTCYHLAIIIFLSLQTARHQDVPVERHPEPNGGWRYRWLRPASGIPARHRHRIAPAWLPSGQGPRHTSPVTSTPGRSKIKLDRKNQARQQYMYFLFFPGRV